MLNDLLGAWVSPKDGKPADGQLVAVYTPGASMCDVWPARWSDEFKTFHAGGGWFEQDEVVYWTPLPEVPNVEVTGAPPTDATKGDEA